MTKDDVDAAVALIARAMNPTEGQYARKTMAYHFGCARHDMDDGRSYFVWRHAGQIAGLVGLHHYVWGPEQNVWLSWFAVDPQLQGQGHGRALLRAIEKLAVERGYRKLLVETYDHEDFARAKRFYASQSFEELGQIARYLDDDSSMLVYGKKLEP